MLAGSEPAIMRERHWLLAAIVVGAVVFWLTTEYVAFYAAVVVTVATVVGLRVVSVRLDWTDHPCPEANPSRSPLDARPYCSRSGPLQASDASARKGDGSLPDPDLAAGRLIAVVLVLRIDAQFEEALDATDAVRGFTRTTIWRRRTLEWRRLRPVQPGTRSGCRSQRARSHDGGRRVVSLGRSEPLRRGGRMMQLASTTVDLARSQFETTSIYHLLFVPLTLGLAPPGCCAASSKRR